MSTLALDDLQHYAFLDPAGGKAEIRRTLARSAIVVVGVDSLTRIFVRYAWAERVGTSTIINKVFEVNERFKPKRFGCEGNAQQSLFAGSLAYEAKHRGAKLPLSAINQPVKVDKEWRIRTVLQPLMAQGRLLIPENMMELRLELQSFPLAATKDLIDALASVVIHLVPKRASSRQNTEEVEALASYLRHTGAPPWYIEQRIQALMEAPST